MREATETGGRKAVCAGCGLPIKSDAEGRWYDGFASDPYGFICDTPAPGAGLTHQPKETA